MINLKELGDSYSKERPLFEELAKTVTEDLRPALRRAGIRAVLDGRAKEVPNLLRKALAKHYEDSAQITDKAGVRVIVNYQGDAFGVEKLIDEQFTVVERQDKSEALAFDQLGYAGIHFLVKLKASAENSALANLVCEIQVHTRAQNAWAEVSHDLLYKPTLEPSPTVKRQIYRLVALVELFDSEISAALVRIRDDPAYQEATMLATLDRLLLPLIGEDYSADLSVEVLRAIEGAYQADELGNFDELMNVFVAENRERILKLYARYPHVTDQDFLIRQPEALVLFERLSARPELLRDVWVRSFPVELLDRLHDAWRATSA